MSLEWSRGAHFSRIEGFGNADGNLCCLPLRRVDDHYMFSGFVLGGFVLKSLAFVFRISGLMCRVEEFKFWGSGFRG